MKLSCLLALCLTPCLVGLASSGETSDNLKQEASQDLFQKPPDLCQLPQARGPCKAALLRYFYNSTSNACEPFTYGGCQGNDNNFETTEMCLRICQPPELRNAVVAVILVGGGRYEEVPGLVDAEGVGDRGQELTATPARSQALTKSCLGCPSRLEALF
ncbi:TPA: tissue factor pathway inhibitor-like [Bos taurus]|nr:TPA: tissue factor pathway inhibitor-like [Bos taurus]